MSASREKRARKEQKVSELETKEKKGKKQGKQLNDRFYSIIAIVIAAVLVISVGFAAFQNIIGSGSYFAAVNVGEDKVYPHEVNYYYINAYMNYVNNYSSYLQYIGLDTSKSLKAQKYSDEKTWHDYFLESAMSSVQEIKMLYKEAAANGVTLTDEVKTQLDSDYESLKASVEGENMEFETYLSSYYGKAMTPNELRRIMGEVYLAQQYGKQVYNDYEYTDEQIRTYYSENKKDFDLVDYRVFFFSSTPDNENATDEEKATARTSAKSLSEIMQSAVKDEQAFIDLALRNAPDDEKKNYENRDYTLREGDTYSVAKSENENMANWLFDDNRVAGESTVIEADNGYYVVFMKTRYRNDYNAVNVRHILIRFETTDDQTEPTEEQIEAARVSAQEIYDEWMAGDATEESFAELAGQKTEDPGSKANGGLYENVYKGQMVEEFERWAFDSSRKPGDTGLVKTDYGYHVMYFVSTGSTYWKIQVENVLRSKEYSDFSESLKAKNPLTSSYLGMFAVGLPNQ